MSERDRYLEAADVFVDLVRRIDDSRWDGPGLGAWDLRSLVGHASRSLVTVLTYLQEPATSEDVASPEAYFDAIAEVLATHDEAIAERGREAGRALGDAPSDAVAGLVFQVRDALLDAADDDLITTIAGGMRVEAYLPTRTFELVVHGLDIGAATGVPVAFSTTVLADAAALAGRIAALRGSAPTVLRALTGRAPLPERFSVL